MNCRVCYVICNRINYCVNMTASAPVFGLRYDVDKSLLHSVIQHPQNRVNALTLTKIMCLFFWGGIVYNKCIIFRGPLFFLVGISKKEKLWKQLFQLFFLSSVLPFFWIFLKQVTLSSYLSFYGDFSTWVGLFLFQKLEHFQWNMFFKSIKLGR